MALGKAGDEGAVSTLGMRIYVRRPCDLPTLASAWMDLGESTRALLEANDRVPHSHLVRLGTSLGRGEWSGPWTAANSTKVLGSYAEWDGGGLGWSVGNVDLWSRASGPRLQARATLMSDDPAFAEGTAILRAANAHDLVAAAVENAWVEWLAEVAASVELIYGEITPRFDEHEPRTQWERKSDLRASYNAMYVESEGRLRGCGWVTWFPDRLTNLLGISELADTGAFKSVQVIAGRGAVLRASDRPTAYSATKEAEIEHVLAPALRPA